MTQGIDQRSSNDYNYQYSVATQECFFDTKWLAKKWQHFHPYIAFGLGAAFHHSYRYYVSYDPFLVFTPLWESENNTAFAFNFGAGFDYDIRDFLRFGVGYRYFDLGMAQFNEGYIDNVPIENSLKQRINPQVFMAQLTFLWA